LIKVYDLQGPEKRAEYGILDNLVRYSCGVEDMEDIWADIEQALAKL
jgi:cystathionine gamma-synthase